MKKSKTKETSKQNKRSSKASAVKPLESGDGMLDDYSFLDWSKAKRGKYARRHAEGTNIVLIAPDVMDVFPNAESVNRALRALADLIRASSVQKKSGKRAASNNE